MTKQQATGVLERCNCGQDECLPARQFNREVELHTAREEAIAKYHRDFNAALESYLGVLFADHKGTAS